MKHIFIINPAAGKYDHTVQFREKIEKACGARNLDFEILVSAKRGDCREYARKAAQSGEEVRLYACGGDGTLNEVVNGVVGYPNAAVTHFPCGSGNDTIKMFSETEPFFQLERLLDAEEAQFDLIRCNETCSINILSIGFDAKVGAGMTSFKRLPLVSGKGSYILSILSNLLHGLTEQYTITLESGEKISGKKTMICICNGRWYGGGFNPVPEAEPDDGMLDVLIVKDVNIIQVAFVVGSYQKGRYKELPKLIRHERCRKLCIECEKQAVVNVDGEILRTKKAEIELIRGGIRFFYPKGLHYAVSKDAQTCVGAV